VTSQFACLLASVTISDETVIPALVGSRAHPAVPLNVKWHGAIPGGENRIFAGGGLSASLLTDDTGTVQHTEELTYMRMPPEHPIPRLAKGGGLGG